MGGSVRSRRERSHMNETGGPVAGGYNPMAEEIWAEGLRISPVKIYDAGRPRQDVIDLAVQSGAYRNPGEVLDQAFEIIREQLDLEEWMFEQHGAIAAHIEKGFAQAQRGELIDGDAAVEILRQRRAERLKPQG